LVHETVMILILVNTKLVTTRSVTSVLRTRVLPLPLCRRFEGESRGESFAVGPTRKKKLVPQKIKLPKQLLGSFESCGTNFCPCGTNCTRLTQRLSLQILGIAKGHSSAP